MRTSTIILVLLFMVACTNKPAAPNKFSDPTLVKIFDLKDRRRTDSLLLYLRSENSVYRREVALAFGSVQDSSACPNLGDVLLEDTDVDVRINAAFALGQTPSISSVNALIPALETKDKLVVRDVLMALGKVLRKDDTKVLTEFVATDTILMEAQAWAFYQLAVRRLADSTSTNKVVKFLLPVNSYQTRLGAAHYFGRSQKVQGQGYAESLINTATRDPRPEVRMAAVSGFRHLEMAKALPLLKDIYNSERDYRVRVNAVRVCQSFPVDQAREIILAGLRDSVEIVAVAASEVMRNLADKIKFKSIPEEIQRAVSQRVKANLYASLLKSSSPSGTVDEIIMLCSTAPAYFKASLLGALGETKKPESKKAFAFLSSALLQASNEKVVQTTAAGAIAAIDRKSGGAVSKQEFLKVYTQAIALGDVAVIGIVSSALTDESLHYKEQIKDLGFLYDAKAKLSLPRDIESLQPLEEAIAYLEGKEKPKPLKNEFNHPIDWKLVKSIPADQKVEIKTTKGNVVIRLLVEEAPGSVANFTELVNKKYFDQKFFHRVVPNFVIQAGCIRGDGFGSEDYSIRSEFFPRRYKTGSVGMASAGKDTEGTQWFITHSPTPHLDGKYTIYAETISGMEVVHAMNVGDGILEVRMVK